jgi:predicted Rdx family selenoprotein
LIESSGGLFEVTMDGTLIFSKKALKRHAEPGEVLRLAREARG